MLKRFTGFLGCKKFSAAVPFLLTAMLLPAVAHAGVPPIVASSEAKYAHGSMSVVTKVVMDSNGNLFTVDEGNNTLWGIPAGSTTPVKLLTSGMNYSQGLAVDKYNDLIVSTGYGGSVYFIAAANVASALAGGSIGSYINLESAAGFSALDGYYTGVPDTTVDQNGVVYMATESCNCNNNEILSVQTQGPSTSATTIAVNGVSQLVVANLPKTVTSLAADTTGHLFYADGSNVYEIVLSASPKVPVKIGSGFSAPTGVTVDAQGNLYVSDNNKGVLWEIPNENGTLNAADQFIVGPSPSIQYGVAFDRFGNFYAADVYNSGSINKVTVGAMNMGSLAVGTTSAYLTLTLEFNAAVTMSSIAPAQGIGTPTEFAQNNYTTCSTTAPTTKGSSCILQYTFTPASTGYRKGAVVIQSAGKPIATAFLAGIGTGAALTFDPGTQAPVTGSAPWQTPSAVALDAKSNIFVADSAANTVQVLSSAGVPVATIGSGLKQPGGVAVDGAGNVLIADTGNNRIVEVPNESGTLNTADQIVVLGTGLSSPTGIFVGPFGGLYVADTGNARVLRLSTYEGYGLASQATVGSGYTKPVGVTTDSSGNVYVTDMTANKIYEVNQTTGVVSAVLSNLNAPTAIAFDIGGSAYFVNSGTNSVLRVPSVNGALNANTELALGSLSLLKTPTGVAVNGSGNVAITDSGVPNVFTLVRTTGALQFGSVDTSQSSISQTLTLTSAGTSSLTLGAVPFTAVGATTSYAVTSAAQNGCTASSTMTVGSTCGYAAVFSPATTGPLTDALSFSTNAVNAAMLSANLTGTGTNLPQSTTTLSANPANPTYGQPVLVTATVTPGSTSTHPLTGTLTFYVNGIAQAPSTLTGPNSQGQYTATFTFPALALSASTNSMGANYNGDTYNSSSHAAPLILVIAREPNTTTATVYPTVAQPVNSPFTFTGVVTPSALGVPTGSMILVAAGTTTNLLPQPITVASIKVNGATVYGATMTYTPPGGNGTYGYQIIYSGDVNFLPSTSNTANVSYQPVGYTITLPSSSFTVTSGQSIQIPVTLTGISGYTGNLTVGAVNTSTLAVTPPCTGLPAYVTCTFVPGIVTLPTGVYPAANPTAVIMMTVSSSVPPPTAAGGSILWPGAIAGVLALALAARKRRGLLRTRLLAVLLLLMLGSLALGVTGCGSGTMYTTPKGTSAVTLTCSGTGLQGASVLPSAGNPNIVNTSTFSLTVQ
jgi:sugar lactone lactonase YvrE